MPAWRATAWASPPATPTHRRGARLLSSRGPVPPARWWFSRRRRRARTRSPSRTQRGNHSGGSNEEIEVMVDGSVVGTFTPASTSYANYTTASFSVTAGSHTISFVGVDPAGPTTRRFSIKSALITLRRRRLLSPVLRLRARGRVRPLTRMIRRARRGHSAACLACRATAAP